MVKKSVYILLTVLLFSLLSVYGVSYRAEIEPIKDKIVVSDQGEFRVIVFNNEDTDQTFRLKTPDYPRWSIKTRPLINPILVVVPAGTNKTVYLYIKPNKKLVGEVGSHFVNVDVISESSGDKITLQPKIGLIRSDDIVVGYVPTVIIETDLPSEINPSEEINFRITLDNQNNLNISNAKLIISSNLINEELDLNILPKEEKIIDVQKKLDPKTKSQNDILKIELIYNGNVVDEDQTSFEIVKYFDLTDVSTVKKSLLRRSETLTFTNKANVNFKGDLFVDTTSMKRLFGSTEPEAEVEDNQYKWSVELKPYESFTVKITENYLGVVILLVALVLIGILIYIKKSPVVVSKQITETESEDGGLTKLKVLINIKNRSRGKLEDISVVDKIPNLLGIEKHTTLGSLKPNKIKKNTKHETIILWKVDELSPGEERVINYYMKSNLQILGGLTLQSAVAKFMLKGKEVTTRSNRAFVKV